MTRGFGTSSGILDVIFRTRYPNNVRQRLYGRKQSRIPNPSEPPNQQSKLEA